ncbi:hypothetical protein NDU88_008413 [Pleurodeles waltl]|uniref:Uncharacterized protein n=1 Tax=Pleurodeles waltl TaxID=8319 RepID=A0AAV7NXR4_PLEWA|nr:hypothetical protein NDU88_008413 [Pleurodeles waltl]
MGGTHAVGRCQLLPISAPVPLFGLPVRPRPGSQIQAPATAKAQSSIQWGTHPLSSPLSVLMGVHLIVFVIFSQGSVVPQGVRWLRGPLTPDSRPGAVRYAHLSQGATHGDPCSTTGPPQMTHSVRQPIPLPFPCPGTPIRPSTMSSGRLWQRWGPYARSVASVEGLHRGGVPPGPPFLSNRVRGPRVRDPDSRRNCERSRTWSARLVPAAVGRSPPGLGFQQAVNSASDASADELGSPASLPPRLTVQRQAVASSRGGAARLSPQRDKQHDPPLAPGLRWGPNRASRRSTAGSPHSVSRRPGPARWEGLIRQAPPELENQASAMFRTLAMPPS